MAKGAATMICEIKKFPQFRSGWSEWFQISSKRVVITIGKYASMSPKPRVLYSTPSGVFQAKHMTIVQRTIVAKQEKMRRVEEDFTNRWNSSTANKQTMKRSPLIEYGLYSIPPTIQATYKAPKMVRFDNSDIFFQNFLQNYKKNTIFANNF